MSTRQILIALASIAAFVVVMEVLHLKFRGDHTDEQLAEIQRDNATDSVARAQRVKALHDHVSKLRTGLAACDALTDLSRDVPKCDNPAAAAEIAKTIAGKLERMSTAPSAAALEDICKNILDEVDAILTRC